MDKGWTQLPLFVILLFFLSDAHGFKGGAHSNAHHWWGQPSDNTFSPRAVQSSVSEVPVIGILPEEVGSSLFTNRPMRRLNLLQFVKGGLSSNHESTSHTQTAPSSSVLPSLPLPLNERYAGSLTPLQGSSSQSATVQSSQKQFTSSYDTQSGSSKPFTMQGSTTYGGSFQPQGTRSQFAPGFSSYPSTSLSSAQGASGQSATVQSSRKQFTSTFTGNSGTQEGPSTPFKLQGSTTYGGSLQPQGTTSQFSSGSLSSYPSVTLFSPQHPSSQSATAESSWKQFTSSYGTQSGSSKPFRLQGSTTYGGSLQPQGTTSQFDSGSPSYYPSVSLFSPQGDSSQSATDQSSQKQFTSSYGTQSGPSKPFRLQGSTAYGGSLQPQDTTSQFSSYPSVSLSSPQGASSQSATAQSSRKQFTSSYGTQEGPSTPFKWQGSTTSGGSLQPQGTMSQFASGSLSYYPSLSLSSPQGASGQSATVQSSRKQYTSSYGTQAGSSKPFRLQGSTAYRGSIQPQDTTSQFSSYPSVSLSSPQGTSSQYANVQRSRKLFASTFTGNSGTQEGSSTAFNLQGSTTYGGSLQPQDTTSQFASGSPSYYPSASPFSPQNLASQSATAESSRKQFTSSYGTQSGSSKPFSLQGSTTYGGSLQPLDTTSQFASGFPSSYDCHCVPSSSTQGVVDQSSQAFQSYSVSQSQKSQRRQPSPGIQTSGAATSQGSPLSQSSPIQSLFPSLSSAGGSSSRNPGPFVSAQDGSSRYGGFSLHSQSPSSKYTPGSHAYAKLGASPLAVSSQSTSDKWSNGLYSSDSLRTL